MRALFFVTLALLGCGSPAPSGLSEPLRVAGAAFHAGDLPGAPVPASDDGGTPSGPQITDEQNADGVVRWSQAGKSLSGHATADAFSVGIRFSGIGSGYWVLPVGAVDPSQNGQRVWSLSVDFGSGIPTGNQTILLAAFDAAGNAGVQSALEVCVVSNIADNLNACDPKRAPPFAMISLTWDADVDLDLVVAGPDGRLTQWKRPTTGLSDGGVPATAGVLDRDSNGACVIDGIRQEDLLWQHEPGPSTWTVYADLFSACGKPAVNFRATLWQAVEAANLTFTFVDIKHVDGALTAADANGGSSPGVRLFDVTLP